MSYRKGGDEQRRVGLHVWVGRCVPVCVFVMEENAKNVYTCMKSSSTGPIK